MKKILILGILSVMACNPSEIDRPPSNLNSEGKFVHPIRLSSTQCSNGKFNLTVDWAIYGQNDWTATFRNSTAVVATVRDLNSTKSSGCVYVAGDKATVLITPNGILSNRQADDSASVVIS